jgi:hypothetical protein
MESLKYRMVEFQLYFEGRVVVSSNSREGLLVFIFSGVVVLQLFFPPLVLFWSRPLDPELYGVYSLA